ncbi:MAG: LysM peptidoglycan-binding domain-containing protein [Planctomycetaceae bacterium]|nr:LysM peptidoglycan-binding domain-containing protein [Planctomycetaceae bacterium]
MRMAIDTEYDEDDDREEDVREKPARRSGPRFGPFVTIAAAILMLFGAVSRLGKTSEAGLWPNFDTLAANYIGSQRRSSGPSSAGTTTVTLGTLPAPQHAGGNEPRRGMRLDMRAMPPPRGDFDLEEYSRREASMPMSLSIPGRQPLENTAPAVEDNRRFDPVPEARPLTPNERAAANYTVREGDNWVKIGRVTGKRWQDIQAANPESRNGLRVGMKLTLP